MYTYTAYTVDVSKEEKRASLYIRLRFSILCVLRNIHRENSSQKYYKKDFQVKNLEVWDIEYYGTPVAWLTSGGMRISVSPKVTRMQRYICTRRNP